MIGQVPLAGSKRKGFCKGHPGKKKDHRGQKGQHPTSRRSGPINRERRASEWDWNRKFHPRGQTGGGQRLLSKGEEKRRSLSCFAAHGEKGHLTKMRKKKKGAKQKTNKEITRKKRGCHPTGRKKTKRRELLETVG